MIRKRLIFLARRSLFRMPFIGHILYSVGSLPIAGQNDFGSLKVLIKRLRSGESAAIFPEGTRVQNGDNIEVREGVSFLAVMANVPIIPCYVHGTDKALPRGAKWLRPAKVKMYLGEPIDVSSYSRSVDKAKLYKKIAEDVMQRIAAIKQKVTQ